LICIDNEHVGELEVGLEEAVVLVDRLAQLRHRLVGLAALAVHLRQAEVALGVVGRELDRLGGVFERVVVAVELRGVLRHALVELARALGVELDELRQHLDGAVVSEPSSPGASFTTLRSVFSASSSFCSRRCTSARRRPDSRSGGSPLSLAVSGATLLSSCCRIAHRPTMCPRASRAMRTLSGSSARSSSQILSASK
jgi:hypothetical protein